MLVLDANVALRACAARDFGPFGADSLVAPPLLWSEARSALHEALWRREVSRAHAWATFEVLHSGRIDERSHPALGERAWHLAEELGLARTYDAEYVALAELLGARLVTEDFRLRRGADRLGFVVGPTEL
jgi:predicted nucleic acid-binding protein